jgi:hypothetical protein
MFGNGKMKRDMELMAAQINLLTIRVNKLVERNTELADRLDMMPETILTSDDFTDAVEEAVGSLSFDVSLSR